MYVIVYDSMLISLISFHHVLHGNNVTTLFPLEIFLIYSADACVRIALIIYPT